jgi:hypothetical protein
VSPRSVDDRGAELVRFALATLPAMRLPDGAFCYEVAAPELDPRGRSLRYTLIVLLGLLRAEAAGISTGRLAAAEVKGLVLGELASPSLSPGDLGLLLWADSRSGLDAAGTVIERLERHLEEVGGLDRLEGLELAWIVGGCASAAAAGCADPRGERILEAVLERILQRGQTASGLFRHRDAGRRARFPHLATQLYSIHSLAEVGRLRAHTSALGAARRAADCLLRLQLPDGGWPWILDVRRGRIVEPYRLYSVHQDAMAPMALFALSEASGEPRYSEAAIRGLEWVWGANELGASMFDHAAGMLYRSINRRGFRDRAYLWLNSLVATPGGPPVFGHGGKAEIERTDRPYHLGWVLEAWCGRTRTGA